MFCTLDAQHDTHPTSLEYTRQNCCRRFSVGLCVTGVVNVVITSHVCTGVTRVFSGGTLSSWPRTLMTFFSRHPLLHGHIRHILPPTTFLSHLRGCNSPNSAPFLPHSKKCLEKIFPSPCPCAPWLRLCKRLARRFLVIITIIVVLLLLSVCVYSEAFRKRRKRGSLGSAPSSTTSATAKKHWSHCSASSAQKDDTANRQPIVSWC